MFRNILFVNNMLYINLYVDVYKYLFISILNYKFLYGFFVFMMYIIF